MIMALRKNKTIAQQAKYYEVDNFAEYLMESYLCGNFDAVKTLILELSKAGRKELHNRYQNMKHLYGCDVPNGLRDLLFNLI